MEGRLIFANIPNYLPTTYKLRLSRMILHTVWRWRRIQDPTTVFDFEATELICEILTADGSFVELARLWASQKS